MEVESYIREFKQIEKKLKEQGIEAVQVTLAILREVAKDRRMEEIANSDPATEKQKSFMDSLGIRYDRNITKKEASRLIDEALDNSER